MRRRDKGRTVQAGPGILNDFYKALLKDLGPQGWWPGRTRFEIIAGAILTQNTSWTNVEKAVKNLRKAGLLVPSRMHAIKEADLAVHLRPAGYFNIKARRLKHFVTHLFDNYSGKLDRMLKKPQAELRGELLSINGIGPETADSIILYAAGYPEFVVDAYTKRIMLSHGLVSREAGYEELKAAFVENLKEDAYTFNEYHAMIVRVGKDFCRPRAPKCGDCPLKRFL